MPNIPFVYQKQDQEITIIQINNQIYRGKYLKFQVNLYKSQPSLAGVLKSYKIFHEKTLEFFFQLRIRR